MKNIENQTANGNSTINNAEQVNYNIFDAPLKFYCDKKVQEKPELKPVYQALQFMVNKDNLKQRFGGANYKYEELVDFIGDNTDSIDEIRQEMLDDGYKSVIVCIAAVIRHFKMGESGKDLSTDVEFLLAEIVNTGLKLKFSSDVISIERFKLAKKRAEEIQKELAPFLNCATQYGNFFQFNNIYLEELTDAPFFTEDVKFSVSNAIIPNLIKPLYEDKPECGLREIIQNACDAMKELEDREREAEWEERVEVHLIEESGNKKLRVRDYGIGMRKEILLEKYFVIGESSKKGSNLALSGQFGIGVLAAFLLGETVDVRTKPYGQKHLYHFTYYLATGKDSNINISIEEDNNFSHGTEFTVYLSSNLSNMLESTLKSALKLDSWYILPDVPIHYYFNGSRKEINCLRGEKYHWIEVETGNEDLEVSYLDGAGGQIILNGLTVQENYEFPCKYIVFRPHIAIKCYGDTIQLNLARNKIKDGLNPVLKILQDHFIKLGIQDFAQLKNRIIDEQCNIKSNFTFRNKYLYNIPIFYCKEGFGIFSKKTLQSMDDYNTIVRVYGYYPVINLNNLEEHVLYLFYSLLPSKSEISYMIVYNGLNYIAKDILKQYFYDATSQYEGFKFEAMKELYRKLIKTEFIGDKAAEFWSQHNHNKKEIFKDLFEKPGYIPLDKEYPEIIEGLKEICNRTIINIKPFSAWDVDAISDEFDIGLIKV